ncbi:MAG: hypothetical protein ACRCST_13860 [Turicibacter sp.]
MSQTLRMSSTLMPLHHDTSYQAKAVAIGDMLEIKLELKKIDSSYVNARYCHSHWNVWDLSEGVEVSHASWYYEDGLQSIVIINTIPGHQYVVNYGDINYRY